MGMPRDYARDLPEQTISECRVAESPHKLLLRSSNTELDFFSRLATTTTRDARRQHPHTVSTIFQCSILCSNSVAWQVFSCSCDVEMARDGAAFCASQLLETDLLICSQ